MNRRHHHRTMLRLEIITGLIVVPLSLAGAPALAQADEGAAATHEHFSKGVAAYNEKRFSDAAGEFSAAYKATPGAFKILFNIGQVNVALGRPVEAVEAYDKYLKQGGSTLSAERRKEVQIEVEHQLAHIGTLVIHTVPEGSDVRIDGGLVGKSPLPRAVRLVEGRHTVEGILAGHAPQIREVDIAGRAQVVVELTLEDAVPTKRDRSTEAAPVSAPAASPQVIPVMIVPAPDSRANYPTDGAAWSSRNQSPQVVATSSSTNWQRVIGCVVVVGGIATATVGGLIAYKASNDVDAASERLANATTDAAYDAEKPEFDAAKKRNQLGWTIAGIGAAALAGGILLVATAPERSSTLALSPWATAQAGGVRVGGAW